MPRASLTVLALLLGALGAQSPALAPTDRVMASSAPDGRNMPGSTPDTPRSIRDDKGSGIGRSGASTPASPGRPGQIPGRVPGQIPVPARPAYTPTPAKPAPTRPNTKAASMPPPMAFFIARGDADACGPGCSEWIGADGAIDAGAAARLRVLLNRVGHRRLPVFFHSPGGSVEGSLAIGRLMRARGLMAGIARTIPQGCDPKLSREESCDRLKRSGRDLPAELDTGTTMCFSACVYAIVGAVVREIGPGAKLGIHSSSFTFAGNEDRASTRPPGRTMRATIIEASYERLGRYFVEMGIDPSLVAAAREISNDRIHVLSRAEIWRFKIDRRGFIEGGWRLSGAPARSVHKSFVAERGGGADFREAVVNLTCASPDRLRIAVALEHAAGDTVAENGIRLVVGGAEHMLVPRRHMTFGRNKTEYDVSSADVPPAFFATAGDTISFSMGVPGSSGSSTKATDKVTDRAANKTTAKAGDFAVRLSTAGLMPALTKLLPLCGMSANAIKAQAAPHAVP